MSSLSNNIDKERISNIGQWLVVCGVFFTNIIELILLMFSVILLNTYKCKIYKSQILIKLVFVLFVSEIIIILIGYDNKKFIQQSIVISLFFLLYEQFFKYNKNKLVELFKKYIKVAYWICLIGLLQELLFICFHVNIFDYVPEYHANHFIIGDKFLRITSTLSEGGWLGTSLLPSIIYLFYYNDFWNILGRKKYVILFVSLFTVSPFVYLSLLIILALKMRGKFKKIKRILSLALIVLFGYLAVHVMTIDKFDNSNPIDSMLMRLHDSFIVISKINDSDIRDVVAVNMNASSAVMASNMYIGFHAPSRLFGTGLGTNSQSQELLIGGKFEDSSPMLLNGDDGYSLFNRILSELGIVGLVLYLLFIYKYRNIRNPLNICFLTMIVGLFLRGGNYVLYGTIFVHFFYYYTSKFNIELKNNEVNINNNSNIQCRKDNKKMSYKH